MSYYDIDFEKLIKMLLPVRLRQQTMIHWLQSLVQPVKELYDKFYQNRNNNIYTLNHNGQVASLQHMLNDMFDPWSRSVYIVDDFMADPLYVYTPAESRPLWLGCGWEASTPAYPVPSWLFTSGEVAYVGYHFIIMMPAAIMVDMERLRALVDRYRLPSRNLYTVVPY